MENTTKMHVEHIAIGMQTTLMILFLFSCLDSRLVSSILQFSSIISIVIVIPISYALGILVDRLCDYTLFSEKKEKKIKQQKCKEIIPEDMRAKAGCKGYGHCDGCNYNLISKQIWKKFDEMEYYNDAMTRKRILRATFFNSVLSWGIVVGVQIWDKWPLQQTVGIACSVILLIVAISSYIVYWKFVGEYYSKQRRYTYETTKAKKK